MCLFCKVISRCTAGDSHYYRCSMKTHLKGFHCEADVSELSCWLIDYALRFLRAYKDVAKHGEVSSGEENDPRDLTDRSSQRVYRAVL